MSELRPTRQVGIRRSLVAVGSGVHIVVSDDRRFRSGQGCRSDDLAAGRQDANLVREWGVAEGCPHPTAVFSPAERPGCEIGLRAQGTRDQEAGPGRRPLAPPTSNRISPPKGHGGLPAAPVRPDTTRSPQTPSSRVKAAVLLLGPAIAGTLLIHAALTLRLRPRWAPEAEQIEPWAESRRSGSSFWSDNHVGAGRDRVPLR